LSFFLVELMLDVPEAEEKISFNPLPAMKPGGTPCNKPPVVGERSSRRSAILDRLAHGVETPRGAKFLL